MESEPIFFISCPGCGGQEVLVPNHLRRDDVYWFGHPDGRPILSMGFCASCGLARVYAYDRAAVRRERSIGPERNPPQQQAPQQPDLGKCKHCGDTLVPANPECGGHLPGSWAVCVKCMRAWQIKDGQVNPNLEVGAAPPPAPPSSESGKEGPLKDEQLSEAKQGLITLVKDAQARGEPVPKWLEELVKASDALIAVQPQKKPEDKAPAEPEGEPKNTQSPPEDKEPAPAEPEGQHENPDPDEGAK